MILPRYIISTGIIIISYSRWLYGLSVITNVVILKVVARQPIGL